jgi:hypothetical protein
MYLLGFSYREVLMRDSLFGVRDVDRYLLIYYEWSLRTGSEILAAFA